MDEGIRPFVPVTARVLAQCKAFDPSFANADEAMVLAWAEIIAEYRLELDDLLWAVRQWYRAPHPRHPLVADLIRLARDRRNDRLDRMRPDERPVIDKAAPDPDQAEIEVARQARDELDRQVARIGAQRSLDREINALPTETCRHCQETLTRAASGLYLHATGKERCPSMPPPPPPPEEP